MVVVLYVDDMIVVGGKKEEIYALYTSLVEASKHFKLTKEVKIEKYSGVDLADNRNGSFEARHPHLINRILKYSGLEASLTNSRTTPATLSLLHKDLDRINRKYKWNYRASIGM